VRRGRTEAAGYQNSAFNQLSSSTEQLCRRVGVAPKDRGERTSVAMAKSIVVGMLLAGMTLLLGFHFLHVFVASFEDRTRPAMTSQIPFTPTEPSPTVREIPAVAAVPPTKSGTAPTVARSPQRFDTEVFEAFDRPLAV